MPTLVIDRIVTAIIAYFTFAVVVFYVGQWFSGQAENLEDKFDHKITKIREREAAEVRIAFETFLRNHQIGAVDEESSPRLREVVFDWVPAFSRLSKKVDEYYKWGRCLDDTRDVVRKVSHLLIGLAIVVGAIAAICITTWLVIEENLAEVLLIGLLLILAVIFISVLAIVGHGLFLLQRLKSWDREFSQVNILYPKTWAERAKKAVKTKK